MVRDAIVLICGLILILSPEVAQATDIMTLDDEGNTGWYTSVALFQPSVDLTRVITLYYDARFRRLRLARCDLIETFCDNRQITIIERDRDNWFGALRIAGNFAVISDYEARTRELELAICDLTDDFCSHPNFMIIDSDGDVGTFLSLATNEDMAIISYYDQTNKDLKLSTCIIKGLECNSIQTVIVDNEGEVGKFTSLQLDGTTAVISYYDETNYELKLATCSLDGRPCEHRQIASVDRGSTNGFGWHSSLAISPDHSAVMSYYDADNKDLKLATCNLSGNLCEDRQITTLDSSYGVGLHTSVALDGSRAIVSYYDITNGDLKMAICNIAGDLCETGQTTTLDNEGDIGKFTSLVLQDKLAIISYYDATRGDVKLVRQELP